MLTLPSAYLAPIPFYAAMLQEGSVQTEQFDHYVKQTFRNRCIIAGPNGTQTLTIPVEKPAEHKCLMRDLQISDHGNWRHLHWNALESSYGKSPFFEFYADDLRPFYNERRWKFLVDFNEEMMHTIFSLLDIEVKDCRTIQYTPIQGEELDLRVLAEPSQLKKLTFEPYYQVFAAKNGFLPHLSIADLLFNMGPEAVLVLLKQRFSTT